MERAAAAKVSPHLLTTLHSSPWSWWGLEMADSLGKSELVCGLYSWGQPRPHAARHVTCSSPPYSSILLSCTPAEVKEKDILNFF